MNRNEMINRLRDMQSQIIHGTDFFGKVADLLEADDAAFENRNRVEGRAHALFTEPLSNGQMFAHVPSQCDPLGFVTVLRGALEQVLAGQTLSNPFILLPDENSK